MEKSAWKSDNGKYKQRELNRSSYEAARPKRCARSWPSGGVYARITQRAVPCTAAAETILARWPFDLWYSGRRLHAPASMIAKALLPASPMRPYDETATGTSVAIVARLRVRGSITGYLRRFLSS